MSESRKPQYRDTVVTRLLRGTIDALRGSLSQVERDVLVAIFALSFLVILLSGSQTLYVMIFGIGAAALAAVHPKAKAPFLDETLDDPRKRLTRLWRLLDQASSWLILAGLTALLGGAAGAFLRRGLLAWAEAAGWIGGAA